MTILHLQSFTLNLKPLITIILNHGEKGIKKLKPKNLFIYMSPAIRFVFVWAFTPMLKSYLSYLSAGTLSWIEKDIKSRNKPTLWSRQSVTVKKKQCGRNQIIRFGPKLLTLQ